MHKYLIIALALFSSVLLGHAQDAVPTIRILPGDVVQNSIQRLYDNGGNLMVLWKYTEAGAKKMRAFWIAHAGQKIITRIGDFESTGTLTPLKSDPPGWVADDGWLKTRTDKFCGISEANAKMIIAGLKDK
jgi:hypothetical protein